MARPKMGTGTVGKRLNHFKTRLSTEPVPIFGLPSFQFEYYTARARHRPRHVRIAPLLLPEINTLPSGV